MYSLAVILKDSAHKSTLFNENAVREVEKMIFTKPVKGIDVP